MTRARMLIAAVVVLAALGAGLAFGLGGSSASTTNDVVILSQVQRRTLQSTIALTGTLARKELSNVTASTQGLLTSLPATDGETAHAGTELFAVDGRPSIAEAGTVPFFRPLTLGDEGADVLQLKQILAAAGDDPGPMTPLFTEQTQFALAQWQAQHGYPNVTPATDQSITVALQQGTGYKLGDQVSAGLIIGPPAQPTGSLPSAPASSATLASYQTPLQPGPTLQIQSVDATVSEGQPATFVITASAAPASDLTVDLDQSGTADSDDVVTPPGSVTLAAGSTSTSFTVQTRVDDVVKPTKSLVMSIASGTGYSVGTDSSAQTDITNDNVPTLTITGGTGVAPGGSVTLTVNASQAPLQATQVVLSFSGSAQAGTDYTEPAPVVVLPAGATSATFTLATLSPPEIEPSRFVVASLSPSPGNYAVGSPGVAVVTINGPTGAAALPTVTLSSATTYLQKGEPYDVSVNLSEAISSPLVVDLSFGGTAVAGVDFTPPGGVLEVPAGQTTLTVPIPTITDNLVETDRTLTVTLDPDADYTVGPANSVSVDITSEVLPELTLSAATGTVAQGQSATFVITANEPVAKNTTVSFTAAGTAQPGQDFEPVVGAALLAAGQSQVSVTIQTLRTDVEFEPSDMVVGSWPTRIGTVNLKAGDPVAPGEAILELTEPDLTVTLQASAANRTLLAVGQTATVQVDGATASAQGTIVELDATPTSVASGAPGGGSSQVYEGRIDVSNLAGADGSAVSITVVDQQVDDAVTVPIAAVKQNGVGADVVRVYSRRTGAITEVPVTTGLSEGSYIQVTKGLSVGQTVVVEVDQPQ